MAQLWETRFEPARRLGRTAALLGLVLVAAALVALCAEYLLLIGPSGGAGRSDALRFEMNLTSLDIAFAAAGSLFFLLIWLAFHARKN